MSTKESVPNIQLFTRSDRDEYLGDLTRPGAWNRFPN